MIDRIQELCQIKGTNITALCKKITGSSGNLQTWKKGNIRNDYLIKIADYFEVSTDYLLGKDDVTFDDFTYALYNESQELDDDAKEQLLDMARFLKQKIKERDSK